MGSNPISSTRIQKRPYTIFGRFKNQCAAVGWNGTHGNTLEGKTRKPSWRMARSALKRIRERDFLVVQLKNNRVGRIGEVVRMKVSDSDWNPTVPPSGNTPDGEKGRRIEVRWDLNVGPTNPDTVVLLPTSARLNPSVARRTISQIDAKTFDRIAKAMRDERIGLACKGVSTMRSLFRISLRLIHIVLKTT